MTDINTWRTAALVVFALAQFTFVVLYSMTAWRKQLLGRILFGEALTVLTVLVIAAAGRIFDFATNDYLFFCLYCSLAVITTFKVFMFVRIQRQGRFPETGSGDQ